MTPFKHFNVVAKRQKILMILIVFDESYE